MEKEQQIYDLLKRNNLVGSLPAEKFIEGMKNPEKHREVYDLLGRNRLLGNLSFKKFQSGLTPVEKKSPDGSGVVSGEPQGTVSAPTNNNTQPPATGSPAGEMEFVDEPPKPKGLFDELLDMKAKSNEQKVQGNIAKAQTNPAPFIKEQLDNFFSDSGPGAPEIVSGIPDNDINRVVTPILKSDSPDWRKVVDMKRAVADLVDQKGQEGWGNRIREEANVYEAEVARANPTGYYKEKEKEMGETHKMAGYTPRQGILNELQTNTIPIAFEDGSDEGLHAANVLVYEQLNDEYNTLPDGMKKDAVKYAMDKAQGRAEEYRTKKAEEARVEIDMARKELLTETDPERRKARAEMIRKAEESLNGFIDPRLQIAQTYAENREDIDRQPGKDPREKMENYLASLTYEYRQIQARQSKAGRDTPVQLALSATIRGGNADSERLLELDQKIRNISPVVLLNESTYWQPDETGGDAFRRGLSSILLGGELSVAAGEKSSRQQQGGDFSELLLVSGINPEQLSKTEIDNIRRKQEQYSWYDSEHLLATGGSSAGLMLQIMGAGSAVKATGLPAKVGTKISSMKKGKTITGIFAAGLESGATYGLAGEMFKNNDDELSFAGGFFGGIGAAGATKVLGAIPGAIGKTMGPKAVEGAKNSVVSMFGDKAAEAGQLIARFGAARAGGGVGEVVEEFGQQMVQIYNSSAPGQQFWADFKKKFGEQFGDPSERTKFIMTSFLMGMGMSAGHQSGVGQAMLQASSDAFNAATPEEQEASAEMLDRIVEETTELGDVVAESIEEVGETKPGIEPETPATSQEAMPEPAAEEVAATVEEVTTDAPETPENNRESEEGVREDAEIPAMEEDLAETAKPGTEVRTPMFPNQVFTRTEAGWEYRNTKNGKTGRVESTTAMDAIRDELATQAAQEPPVAEDIDAEENNKTLSDFGVDIDATEILGLVQRATQEQNLAIEIPTNTTENGKEATTEATDPGGNGTPPQENSTRPAQQKTKRKSRSGQIRNPVVREAIKRLDGEFLTPRQRVLLHFMSGGRINRADATKILRDTSEIRARDGVLSNKNYPGQTIRGLADSLWEQGAESENHNSMDYQNEIEDVLRTLGTKERMAEEVLGPEDLLAEQEYAAAVNAQYAANTAGIVSDRDTNEEAMGIMESLSPEEISAMLEERLADEALLERIERDEKRAEEAQAAQENKKKLTSDVKRAKSAIAEAQRELDGRKKALDRAGKQKQYDISGRAPAQNMLFQPDLSNYKKLIRASEMKLEKAKEALAKAQAALAAWVPANQTSIDTKPAREYDNKGYAIPAEGEVAPTKSGEMTYTDGKWKNADGVIKNQEMAMNDWRKTLSLDEQMKEATRRLKSATKQVSAGMFGGEATDEAIKALGDIMVILAKKGVKSAKARVQVLRNTFGEIIEPFLERAQEYFDAQEEQARQDAAEDREEETEAPKEKRKRANNDPSSADTGPRKRRGFQETIVEDDVNAEVKRVVQENEEYYNQQNQQEVLELAKKNIQGYGGFDGRYDSIVEPYRGDPRGQVIRMAERLLTLYHYGDVMRQAALNNDRKIHDSAYNRANNLQKVIARDATAAGQGISMMQQFRMMNPESMLVFTAAQRETYNNDLRNKKHSAGGTTGEQIDESRKNLEAEARAAANEVADSDLAEDFARDNKPKGDSNKKKAPSAKIKEIKARRDKFRDQLKNAKFGEATMMGLNQDAIEAIAGIAQTYIEEGYVRLADWTAKMKAELEGVGIDPAAVDLDQFWDENLAATVERERVAMEEARARIADVTRLVKEYMRGNLEGPLVEQLIDIGISEDSASTLKEMVDTQYDKTFKETEDAKKAVSAARELFPDTGPRPLTEELRQAIRDHWADPDSRSLRERFGEIGLTEEESIKLENIVLDEMEAKMAIAVEREARRVAKLKAGDLKPRTKNRPSVTQRIKDTAQRRADNKKAKEERKKPRETQSLTDRLMEAVLDGDFRDARFMDAFAEVFGFTHTLSMEQMQAIRVRVEAMHAAPVDSEYEMDAIMDFAKEVQQYIPRNKWTTFGNIWISLQYAAVLSGPPTHAKNGISAGIGIPIKPLRDLTNLTKWMRAINGKGPMPANFEHFMSGNMFWRPVLQGAKKGRRKAIQVMERGTFDTRFIEEVKRGTLDVIPVLEKEKWVVVVSYGGKEHRLNFLRPPSWVGRALYAADRMMHSVFDNLHMADAINEYYYEQGLRGKALRQAVKTEMSESDAKVSAAREQAESEAVAYEAVAKKKMTRNQLKIRTREILRKNYPVPEDTKSEVNEMAEDDIFAFQRRGIGGNIGTLLGRLVNSDIFVAAGTKTYIMFTKIPGNIMDYMIDHSPWGFLRAYGYSPTGIWARRKDGAGRAPGAVMDTPSAQLGPKGSRKFYEQMGRAWFGTLAYAAVFALFAGTDDDDMFSVGGTTGEDAYQFKFFGKPLFDYRLMLPLVAPLATVGEFNNRGKKEMDESIAMRFALSVFYGNTVIKDMSVTKGFQDLARLITDLFELTKSGGRANAERVAETLVKQYLGFVARPLPQNWKFVQQAYQWLDPSTYTTGDVRAAFMYAMGIGMFTNEKSIDIFGNVRKRYPGQDVFPVYNWINSDQLTKDRTRFLTDHGIEIQKVTNDPQKVEDDESLLDIDPNWKMPPEMYARYAELAGKNFGEALDKYRLGESWKKDTDVKVSRNKYTTGIRQEVQKLHTKAKKDAREVILAGIAIGYERKPQKGIRTRY